MVAQAQALSILVRYLDAPLTLRDPSCHAPLVSIVSFRLAASVAAFIAVRAASPINHSLHGSRVRSTKA